MPTKPTTEILLTNPYATQPIMSTVDLQLLLLAGLVCLIVGLLLAEQTTLRNMISAGDETMRELLHRRATETTYQ